MTVKNSTGIQVSNTFAPKMMIIDEVKHEEETEFLDPNINPMDKIFDKMKKAGKSPETVRAYKSKINEIAKILFGGLENMPELVDYRERLLTGDETMNVEPVAFHKANSLAQAEFYKFLTLGDIPSTLYITAIKKINENYFQENNKYLTKQTFASYFAAVKSIISVAGNQLPEKLRNDIANNMKPAKIDIELMNGEKRESHALAKSDIDDIYDFIDYKYSDSLNGKKNIAIFKLLTETGMRRSEVAQLDLGNLVIESGDIIRFSIIGKGGKARSISLTPDARVALKDWLEEDEIYNIDLSKNKKGKHVVKVARPIFFRIRKGDKIIKKERSLYVSDQSIYNVIKLITKDYNDDVKSNPRGRKEMPEDLATHDMRRTFATIRFDSNVDAYKISLEMGHEKPETTQIYNQNKAKQAFDELSKFNSRK